MGRGRAPCCEKVGLNRGAWTPEEDMRLIAYIHKYGHGNWRALPKQAGLLRCGKSCRLRWINYLRPDIKRGNFSAEEEETIIKLHELLGNKWSKIASSLPGRTDNEIKNVWNTHLKKRVKSNEQSATSPTLPPIDTPSSSSSSSETTEHKCSHPCQDNTMEPEVINLTDELMDYSTDEILDIDIDPDIWNDVAAIEEGEAEENKRWLAHLEEELGLFDDNNNVEMVVVGEGDPVTSYFQKIHSSISPM